MKRRLTIALITLLAITFFSFTDFLDYWTVKLNGKVIYDASNDRGYNRLHLYTVSIKEINVKDTLEVEYFTDSPCYNCIHNYFITEFTNIKGEAYEVLGTYLKEQKSFGPKAYKIALTDILNSGSNGTIKSIHYYVNADKQTHELCRINFR